MNELEEAIGAVTATSGSSLIQKYIDPLILEYVRRYSPLLSAIPSKKLNGTNAYNWVTRTALPDGGTVSDGGARPVSSSTWTQSPTVTKQFQAVGAVTGFAQAVTGVIADLQRAEIDGAMTALTWAVESSLVWGNDGATAAIPSTATVGPDMRGLDYQVNTYSGALQNSIDTAHNAFTSFSYLDQAIDLVEENAAQPVGSDWMFVCSPKMSSKINQLLTNQQRFVNENTAGAGIFVPSYRDVPIVKTSFLAARSVQMGTVTPTVVAGGTLTAGAYRYQVSAVINRFGEIAASPEVTATTATTNLTANLAFSTPTGPDGNGPVLYKVYRSLIGGGAGTETLLGVVASVDDLGVAVTSIQDTGVALGVNGRPATILAPWPTTYQDGNLGALPRNVGDEDIFLIPKNENFLVRPYVRDFFAKELAQTTSAPDVMPFYIASDTALAVRAPKYVSRISRVNVTL